MQTIDTLLTFLVDIWPAFHRRKRIKATARLRSIQDAERESRPNDRFGFIIKEGVFPELESIQSIVPTWPVRKGIFGRYTDC